MATKVKHRHDAVARLVTAHTQKTVAYWLNVTPSAVSRHIHQQARLSPKVLSYARTLARTFRLNTPK